MNKTSKHLIIKRAAVVVASTVFSLVLVEFALRLVAPIYPTGGIPQAYRYDPELAYRLQPSVHFFKLTDFQQEVQVNQLGTTNFQDHFGGYRTLVFTVGDSYTNGIGVPADASYPFQLDLILNSDQDGFYRENYGVVNLGTAGYGGEQSLLALRRWSSLLHPRSVILYLGCDNDYEEDQEFKNGYRHQFPVTDSPRWGRLVPLKQWFNDLQIGLRIKMLTAQKTAEARKDGTESKPSTAELEAPVLDQLEAYAKGRNSLLVVSWSYEGPSYEWAKSWAAGKGIAFADWAPKVKSVQTAIPKLPQENQHSSWHHRGWVNHLIAQEFARHVKAHQ